MEKQSFTPFELICGVFDLRISAEKAMAIMYGCASPLELRKSDFKKYEQIQEHLSYADQSILEFVKMLDYVVDIIDIADMHNNCINEIENALLQFPTKIMRMQNNK